MTQHTETTNETDHETDHAHGGIRQYLMVFVALCGLTTLSFIVGNSSLMVSNVKVGWALMMAISCGKALLVIMFFMHLLWEENWKWVLTIPASMMSVFLVLMLVPDVGRRTHNYDENRWLHTAKPAQYDQSVGHGEHAHGESADDSHEQQGKQEHP